MKNKYQSVQISKKVLFITPYYTPHTGGVEIYVENIAKELKIRYGWECIIVTTNLSNNKFEVQTNAGITIYRLPILLTISNTPINPMWYFHIKKIIRAEKPDIINAHSPVPFMADIASFAKGELPFILTYHAASLYKYGKTSFNFIIWLYKIAEKQLFKKSTNIIVVSDFLRKNISEYENKTFTVENAISEKNISHDKVQNKANELVFIAQLDKTHNWKGLDLIIEAVKQYRMKFDENIHLTVIGDGNWKKHYEGSVKLNDLDKFITFVGKKTGSSKIALIQKAKALLIYPKTANDAFPTVILESWAQGVPVIAAKIGSIPYIITDKSDGLLVNPNVPNELAEALNTFLKNSVSAQKLGTNGRSKLKKYFTLEKQSKKVNDIFEKSIRA